MTKITDTMKDILNEDLQKSKDSGLYRSLRGISSSPDHEITINGKTYLNFSSNNYLGLATHKGVKQAAIEAIEHYGVGGTSSRLVAGTLDLHLKFEEELASFKKTEKALIFPSGLQANIGVMSSLIKDGDCVIMDKLNHASLWDGAKLSGARIFVYPHRDMDALEKILKRVETYRCKLVATDSVFSMDGDLAPLKDIAFLAKKYGAWSMVDEAHATGVFGKNGRGLCEHFDVEGDIDVIIGTLSKAFGSQGGFVCGSKELIEFIVNFNRSFIYTTALSPANVGASSAALHMIQHDPDRRKKLLLLAEQLRKEIKGKGHETLNSQSQIVPCLVGQIDETVELSKKLFDRGIFVPAMRPPTVPEGECRLRFSLTSDHSEKDIEKVLQVL